MKKIKKTSLALISLFMMLTIVGYINYKYNPKREQNLGQTVYVNGKDSYTYENVSIYDDEKNNDNIINNKNENNKEDENSKIQNNAKNEEESSVAVFKYDRDNMYSELSENYTNIIENSNSSKEQINEYQGKLDKLIEEKNLINMVENVIKSKGIKNVVIIPTNNDNINVILEDDEKIEKEKIAQIQQILVDQLGANANKITITQK